MKTYKQFMDAWDKHMKANPDGAYPHKLNDDLHKQKVVPNVGDRVYIETWKGSKWATLKNGRKYVDKSFPGSQFTIESGNYTNIPDFPINIKVTGKPMMQSKFGHEWASRIQVEFVKDGEKNDKVKAWLIHEKPLEQLRMNDQNKAENARKIS